MSTVNSIHANQRREFLQRRFLRKGGERERTRASEGTGDVRGKQGGAEGLFRKVGISSAAQYREPDRDRQRQREGERHTEKETERDRDTSCKGRRERERQREKRTRASESTEDGTGAWGVGVLRYCLEKLGSLRRLSVENQTETDRQTDRDRERERDKQRRRHRERDRDTSYKRGGGSELGYWRWQRKQGGAEGLFRDLFWDLFGSVQRTRERQTDRDRQRQRQIDTEIESGTRTETERQREGERD